MPAAKVDAAVRVKVPEAETGLAVIPDAGVTVQVTVPLKPFTGVAVKV